MANTSKGRFPSYGLVRGPLHSQGGVPASVANGPDVELEGGEYIIPKEAVPDYLPVLQQITQVGRDRQQMQNGNTAIDALIASASMQNGIAQPKSPMYQEGGQVQTKNLRGSRIISRDIGRDGDMFTGQVIMGIPADQVGGENGMRYYLSEPQRSDNMSMISSKGQFDAMQKMAFSPQDSLPADLVEGYFDRQNKKSPLGFLKNLIGKEQGGMIEYEDGGEVHSRRMYNQGTGFNKKKSDLDGDGNISEYERKRGIAIAKSMGKMQEGGMVADKTRVSQTYYPTESLNLPMANLASPMNVGSVSQAPMSNQDIAQIVMDIATPGSVIGSIGKKAAKVNPFSMKAKASKIANRRDASGRLYRDPIGGLSKKGMLKLVDEAVPENTMDAYGESLDYFKDMDADDLADVVRGAYGLARNPKFYGEERIGQGAFDLGREGVKMALDDIKNLNIKQQGGPINNYQMGGMVNRQPMMQRPMNPAMNFSPMQQMNPRMYQDGGQVQTRKQQEMRNPELYYGPPVKLMGPSLNNYEKAEQEFEAFMDSLQGNQDINPFTGEPIDTDADKQRLKERMKKSKIPRSSQRMPMEEGGQVQLRRQAEKNLMSRQPKEKMDVIFPFSENVPSFLYPDFIGPRTPMQNKLLERFLDDMMRNARGDKKFYIDESDKQESGMKIAQEGGMVSNNNLMGSMASDQRIAALQPDIYQSKSENGVSTEQRMEVPKLAEAILPIYGLETPLSKNQGSMLRRNNVPANVLNPQVKGLINRVLVQRLSAESN